MKQRQLTNGLVELIPDGGKALRCKGEGNQPLLPGQPAPVLMENVGLWEEVDAPAVEAYSREEYKAETVRLIRQRYDGDDEAALLRKVAALLLDPAAVMAEGDDAEGSAGQVDAEAVVAKFREYNAYAERCKAQAVETLLAKKAQEQ